MKLTTADVSTPLSVDEVIELEKSLEARGTPLLELMSRAGTALAQAAEETVCKGAHIVVFAGNGNNGGDGWVAARLLADDGYDVTLITARPTSEITAEPARSAIDECLAANEGDCAFEIRVHPSDNEIAEILANRELVIDAMLGTGFAHERVREPFSHWIGLVNEAHARRDLTVIAADCPSGFNAREGKPSLTAIEADITVTMLAAKTGMLGEEGREYVGKLLVAPLVDWV